MFTGFNFDESDNDELLLLKCNMKIIGYTTVTKNTMITALLLLLFEFVVCCIVVLCDINDSD